MARAERLNRLVASAAARLPIRRSAAALMVPLLLLVGAGCSASTALDSDPSPVPVVTQDQDTVSEVGQSPTASESPAAPSAGDATDYFTAIASNDEETTGQAQKLAAPKSVAAAYALHLSTTAAADLDGGYSEDADELNVDGGDYESCPSEGKCTTWSDVAFSGGKVSSFTVNGVDINKRISVGSGDRVKVGGLVQVRFISAYQSVASKALYVTFEFKSGGESVTTNLDSAKYRDPSGRQATATSSGGPNDLDRDSSAHGYAVFKGAKPGGVVTLDIYDSDYDDHYVRIKTG